MHRTPPAASSENARRTMRANKRRDTSVELAVRRRLHATGLRYRVDYAADPTDRRRRVDIVFTKLRLAIYIDGCFWHGCPDHYVQPKTNVDYWRPKIARNMERDRESVEGLEAAGWTVLRFWEHEDPDTVAASIAAAVRLRRGERPPAVGRPG